MTIQLIIDNTTIPIKKINFSDGSSNIKVEIPEGFTPKNFISLSVDTMTPVDNYLWDILLVLNSIGYYYKDHSVNLNEIPIKLSLPYLPHGRADRVFEKGNPHPLSIFFGMISVLLEEYKENFVTYLTDPHSEYYKEWAEDGFEFEVKYQHQCFVEVVKGIQSGDYIISPDKGAKEKIYKLQNHLDKLIKSVFVVESEKKRDPTNGRILETTLPEGVDLTGKVCYIVDDICDGGGTFIPLAEKLREAGAKEVHLYVTHGIFAKGLSLFKGKIDKLHVYQTVSNYVTMTDIMNYNEGKEVR